jgi:AraC-like DNA-binding protein
MTAVREFSPQGPLPAVHPHREEHRARTLGTAEIAAFDDALHLCEAEPSVCRLVFQCVSRSLLSCGGSADLELTAGSWTAHVSPAFELQTGRGSGVLSLAFPSTQLSRSLLMQVRAAFVVSTNTAGAAQMCLDLARTCLARAEPVSDAVSATLGDALIELAKLAIIERSGSTRGETIRETVRTRILGLVNRNLADPDLTIERIAERMRCTKRYLHKVFSEEGETLSQYIWARRLELCRAHLIRPELSDKSITEIAFACGFSNAAHFSRSFRARFGQSPRAFRQAALHR